MSTVVGAAEPPTSRERRRAARALTFSGCGSENAPLTSCPVAVELGSATLSAASPAVEITLAVVEAS